MNIIYNVTNVIKIMLVLCVFVTLSLSVYADDPVGDIPVGDGGIFGGITNDITDTVNKTLGNLSDTASVITNEIFSPVLSEVTNLVVNPEVKIVYNLELPVNTPIYKAGEVIQPIFDLRVEQPVEFRIYDQRVLIDDEYIIDYKEIMSQIVQENEVFPPIQTEIQSEINSSEIYDLTVVPEVNSAIFKFIYKENEVQMPVYSDFKIEDKKLYLIHNEEVHDLRLLPPEIYSAIYDLRVEEPDIIIKELSLKIEDEKPIYDLRVEQPATILWIFPTTIESKYVIDPADGNAKLVDSPWYITSEKLGGVNAVGYIKIT